MPPAKTAAVDNRGRTSARHWAAGWPGITVVALGLAAISLWVMPDRIAYDPYSWAIWGREILHGHLNTRHAATSVKPLPMLYDTLFAVTGSHLPTWWLYAARVGDLLAFGAVFRLARRLSGLPAAVVAVVAFAVCDGLLSYLFMRGMSEPMAAAAMVAAVDFWLLSRHRLTIGCLIVAAYLRPEAWPFLLVCLVWLAWRRSWWHRLAAVGVGGFVPFSWFLIDWFGARTFNRSVNAASLQSQGGPLLHHHPGLTTFTETWQLASGPVVVLFGVGVVLALGRWWRSAHPLDVTRLDPLLTISLITMAWLVIDAVLAQGHFATGAPRYLLPADALGCVVVGWAVVHVVDWLIARSRTGLAGRARFGAMTAVTAVAVALATLTPALIDTGRHWHDGVRHGRADSLLERHLATAIRLAGGRDAVLRCGAVATQDLQVPLVAWRLHVPIAQVGIDVSAPGTVFQQAGQPAIPAGLAGQFHVAADVAGSPLSSWRALSSC